MDTFDAERKAMIEAGVPLDILNAQLEVGGHVWTTETVQQDFKVLGFMAPFVRVERKADGARGTMTFTHRPRYYFAFTADE